MNVTVTNEETIEQHITIQDAMCLMTVLENDIPMNEKSKIALLLLVLSANPKFAENGDVITNRRQTNYYDCDEYGWGF